MAKRGETDRSIGLSGGTRDAAPARIGSRFGTRDAAPRRRQPQRRYHAPVADVARHRHDVGAVGASDGPRRLPAGATVRAAVAGLVAIGALPPLSWKPAPPPGCRCSEGRSRGAALRGVCIAAQIFGSGGVR